MTTPTQPAAPQKITADELREQFAAINERLDQLAQALTTITAGIQHAATATPPAVSGQFTEMIVDSIIMTFDDLGKAVYKGKGTPFNKYGVRIWDEVLPALGVDPASLHTGTNPVNPIHARVLMRENEGKVIPQKITGKF